MGRGLAPQTRPYLSRYCPTQSELSPLSPLVPAVVFFTDVELFVSAPEVSWVVVDFAWTVAVCTGL